MTTTEIKLITKLYLYIYVYIPNNKEITKAQQNYKQKYIWKTIYNTQNKTWLKTSINTTIAPQWYTTGYNIQFYSGISAVTCRLWLLSVFLHGFYLLYSRMAMTMQMMKMTARTGPTTQISPSSSSIMGCGSISANITGSEYGLAEYNICKKNHHSMFEVSLVKVV